MRTAQLRRFRMGTAANLLRQLKNQGLTQPSLNGLRRIALALHVSLDKLVFGANERGPKSSKLALLFEAVADLPADEQRVAQAVLDGLIVKHRTKQLVGELNS